MQIINLLVIPVILISIFYKNIRLSYLIALLLSFGAATFVYTGANVLNILFTIIILNLTPLVCWRFTLIRDNRQRSLEDKKAAAKSAYEEMLKERTLIRQSNSLLGKEVSRIVELYGMTRDMSSVSGVEETFDILGRRLKEHFRFKSCRLILVDEELGLTNIKEVFALEYAQQHPQKVIAQRSDTEMLRLCLRAQKSTFIKDEHTAGIPLFSDSKFFGTLAIEELPLDTLENFSILANQFSLGFKKVKLHQKVQELALTDGLTGLFVRRYFLERLEEELQRSARHHLHLAFLMLDIDHFKQCNDRYGHLTGDVVLREVAARIKACVREIDLVARYGGEEFCVLLPDTDEAGAKNVAERIRANIDRHKFRAYDESMEVKVSIGAALYPRHSDMAQGLIDKSDQALYRAKQGGRNRLEFY
jgi:diguanylate cyclase (GGDEF)-like protein